MNVRANVQIVVSAEDLRNYSEKLIEETLSKMSKPEENESYIDVSEVINILKVERSTLWRWNKNGYLKSYKIGGKVRYKLSEVKGLLSNNC